MQPTAQAVGVEGKQRTSPGGAKDEPPTHIPLAPDETGLSELSTIQAENITTVRKTSLRQPNQGLRRLPESVIGVQMAMGFPDRA